MSDDAEVDPNEEPNTNPILNMLFWIIVEEMGGTISLSKETLKGYTTDKMGAVTFEYHDDDPTKAVTVTSISRAELLTRYIPSNETRH